MVQYGHGNTITRTGPISLPPKVTRAAPNLRGYREDRRPFGVLWTPMSYFHPGGGGERAIRLSTSYLTPADIEEGTARLTRFIESEAL